MATVSNLPWKDWVAYKVQKKPSVGDPVWWHQMQMTVTSLDKTRMRFSFKNEHYAVFGSLRDVRWNKQIEMWVLPGTEDEMPQNVRGIVVAPAPHRCLGGCGKVMFRPRVCDNCKSEGRG